MGNCCFKDETEPSVTGQRGAEASGQAAGGGDPGGGGGGKPPLPKSKRGLNKEQQSALNALYQEGLIECEDDVYKTDFSDGSMPPLHSQARKGNFKAVHNLLLLDLDKSSTRLIYGSRTPLHQASAAKQGRLQTCKLLLNADDWQLSQKTTDGRTPYHMLSESDDDAAVVIALFVSSSGPEALAEKRVDGSNCLHMACSAGRLDMVEAVIGKDATLVNVVDGEVRTCLHLACNAGHLEVVKALCGVEGVQFANKDRKGFTCLALAAMSGHKGIVQVLLGKDKSLASIRDRAGKSAFDLAVEFGKTPGHWEAAKALLQADPTLITGKPEEKPAEAEAAEGGEEASKPKPKPKLGGMLAKMGGGAAKEAAAPSGASQSALHYAALHGSKEGVELCIEADSQMIKSKNAAGNTPMHMAAEGGHVAILELLVSANGGVGEANNDGQNLLHVGAAKGRLDVVSMLLEKHPELAKSKDAKSQTPLASASLCAKPDPKVVKKLLDAVPDELSEPDAEGKTLLHCVAEKGKSEDLVWLFGERGGSKLIKTKDKSGADCIANAAPNAVTILEELLDREQGSGDPSSSTEPAPQRNV